MSNKIGIPAIQSQINSLQTQIDSIERGQNIDFSQSNYILLSSSILDPNTGLFNGTEGQLLDKYISNTANINGTKIADNSIPNSKLINIDGSKIIDGTITSQQISNGTIQNNDIAGNADIEQSKILNLTNDLTNINTNVTTLQNYFFNSRLKLSNLTKSNNNYQVLSQDSSGNDPSYRQLDSNYIVSLDQSKINQNNNNQYIKYCDSLNYNNVTTFINSLSVTYNAFIYPFNNLGGGYTINTNDTWQAINCNISGFPEKGVIAQSVNIDSDANTNILNIGNATNIYGQYYNNLNIRSSQTNIKIFLNGYFENMQFKKINLTVANNSFIFFYNCTFNDVFNIVTIGTGSSVFIFNCNFNTKLWTQTSNNGSVILSNCSNLPSLTLLSGWFFTGINGTTTQSQINVSNKGFYDTATNTKYLYTSSDIATNANILGSQLSTNAGITNNQITSINSDKLIINSNLNMNNFKISTNNNTFTNNDYITKLYGDTTYASGAGFASLANNNIYTGTNTFNNSVFINEATADKNPITLKQYNINNLISEYYPYPSSLSFSYDFSDLKYIIIQQSTDFYIQYVYNKSPYSFSYNLYNNRLNTLLRPKYDINLTAAQFIPSNYTFFALDVTDDNFQNAQLQQYTMFIVFRPAGLGTAGETQTILTKDYTGSNTKTNVKIISSSARNGWTSSNQSLAINCGTLNGAVSNGWYKLTRNNTNLINDEITLTSMIGKTHLLVFNYHIDTVNSGGYSTNFTMSSWVTCPSNNLPFDTLCASNVSCLYQTASTQNYMTIGASASNGFINTETSQLYNGYIMEILIYNNIMTEKQRKEISITLTTKWGII